MNKKNKSEPTAPPASSASKTLADQIWDDIKNRKIEMFALPNQFVSMHCKPVPVDPNKLFLLPSVGSVLTALEMVISPKYVVERMDRFLVVSPAPPKI